MKKLNLFFAASITSAIMTAGFTLGCNDNGDGVAAAPATYAVTVIRSPSAGGTVSFSPNEQRFAAGTEVTITARASVCYEFVDWTSTANTTLSVDEKFTFVINSNLTLRANFQLAHVTPSDSGVIIDLRDSADYPYTRICGRDWFAKNLNYDTLGGAGSWCYDDDPSNCEIYGRLYDWTTAMNIARDSLWSGGANANHQGLCPNGWRLPNTADWNALMTVLGGAAAAGLRLKSDTGWRDDGNGIDDLGFSALPGGRRWSDGGFHNIGAYGYWWTAANFDAANARHRYMYYDSDRADSGWRDKTNALSVRCVRH